MSKVSVHRNRDSRFPSGFIDFDVAYKTADQIVNNSTTLVNDTHLLIAIGASEVWWFDLYIYYNSAAVAADIKVTFTVPTGATGEGIVWSRSNNVQPFNAGTASAIANTSGLAELLRISGLCRNSTNAGNITFQWAQNAAQAVNTTVYKNSVLIAYRVE